ncbi:MAG: cytidine deaminase [Myxococcales bacterium]|nr:cytidine deaminase [Myxococcales bacterium]
MSVSPLTEAQWQALSLEAERARRRAYAPYSGYKVGAALLTDRGVVRGCNVENASYPLCVCAEAATVAKAVGMGRRTFLALAVATEGPEPGAPCGACRQILAEFALDLPLALVVAGVPRTYTSVRALLPLAFTPQILAESTTSKRL